MYCTINHSSNKNSPHVAKCGPLRAGRMFSPHVRRDLSLDLQKFWSRLEDSPVPLSLLFCLRPNQREGTAKDWGRGNVKHLHLKNKITAMVMLVDVGCINFHSFVLGILSDGKQKNITLGDGYTRYRRTPFHFR